MHGPVLSRRYARPLVLMAVLSLVAALVPIIPAVAAPVSAQPTLTMDEIWVDDDAAGPGTGTEADPFPTLTDGLAVAGEGSIVYVAAGDYGPDDETLPLVVPSGVTIQGEYDSEQGLLTWLYGEYEGDSPIMVVSGADYVGISDIGFAENMNIGAFSGQVLPMAYGAGIFVEESYLVIDRCSFEWLLASGGSAIYAEASDVLVENSEFELCGNAVMEDSVESADIPEKYQDKIDGLDLGAPPERTWSVGMQQPPMGCEFGGAVLAFDSGLDFYDSVFLENTATFSGGAILSAYGRLSTTSCGFFGNEAEYMMRNGSAGVSGADAYGAQASEPFGGGGVSSYMNTYESTSDWFVSNYAEPGAAVASNMGMTAMSRTGVYANYGAAVVALDYSLEADSVASFGSDIAGLVVEPPPVEPEVGLDIDACEFTDNDGLFTTYASVQPARITNSLYVSNEAYESVVRFSSEVAVSSAGPVESAVPVSSVEGCTFSDNWADFAIIEGDPFDHTALVNSIIWDAELEAGAGAADAWVDATNVNAWNNDIGGVLEADIDVDNISEDPMYRDPMNWDFRLMPGSPCIDTGADAGPVESDIEFDPRPWDFDFTMRPNDGDGDGEALYDMGAFEYLPSGRIGGANRFITAVETSQQFFGAADSVVLATGMAFADGLAGSGLAGLYDAPLLLTNGITLMPEVASEIERLGASRVFVLGGEDAISAGIEEALMDMDLDVVRIGGVDRYETAALIAEHLFQAGATDGEAFIARGDNFPDALAAAPIAYANHMPVLLVQPDALPEHTIDVWHEFGITGAVVVGGNAAVSASVAGEIKALGVSVERVSGANRYETAANLAEWAWDGDYAGFWVSGVATGEEFADALSGGAGIGSQGGVLLLTPYASVAPACEGAVIDHKEDIATLQTFGGPSAVSASVYDYLMELLD